MVENVRMGKHISILFHTLFQPIYILLKKKHCQFVQVVAVIFEMQGMIKYYVT